MFTDADDDDAACRSQLRAWNVARAHVGMPSLRVSDVSCSTREKEELRCDQIYYHHFSYSRVDRINVHGRIGM
jgi:hypothetical protein